MPMTPKQMIRLLKSNGFVEVRQTGSHLILRNEQTGKQTTVPMHTKDLNRGIDIRRRSTRYG